MKAGSYYEISKEMHYFTQCKNTKARF